MSRSRSIVKIVRDGTTAAPIVTIRYRPDPRLDDLIDEVFGHEGAHRNGSAWSITRRFRLNAFCIAARARGHFIHTIDRRRSATPKETA